VWCEGMVGKQPQGRGEVDFSPSMQPASSPRTTHPQNSLPEPCDSDVPKTKVGRRGNLKFQQVELGPSILRSATKATGRKNKLIPMERK
jgi:hypothetical protein